MKRLLAVFAVTVLVLTASGLLLAQSDPLVGTWKFNFTKSHFTPAGTAPKSDTRTVEAQGNGARYSYEGVAGDGSRIARTYTTNYDGKDVPETGEGIPNGADTIAVKRVDANTTTSTSKKAGKVVQTVRTVVSKDGKVLTMTAKGTDAQGRSTSATIVWDKQ